MRFHRFGPLFLAATFAVSALLGAGCLDPELKPLSPCTVSANVAEVKQNAVDKVDLLFMVDNSNSMTEEQTALAMQLPRLVSVLTTGDRDQDGTPDFPPAKDLHVGVVSSDMGVGGFSVPTCTANPTYGDDGVLRTKGNTAISGCSATYPSGILEYRVGGSETTEQFSARFTCIARMGTGGCGFEQQLEAVLKAVYPAEREINPPFVNNTRGHGGPAGGTGANAGFVRDDSVLAIVIVTDEEDCSLSDPRLADTMGSLYTGNLNLRCFNYKDPQHPVSRYVTNLASLRADNPDLLVIAGIVGVPPRLVADANNIDYNAILADEEMREVVDSSNDRLRPSCNTSTGIAFPPRRIVEMIQQFGDNGVVQSICQSDFGPALDAVIRKISDVLGNVCLPRKLNPDAEGRVGCDVVQVLPVSGDITRCSQITDRGVDGTPVRIVDGAEVCKINQAPDPDGVGSGVPATEGWFYDDFSVDVQRSCGADGQRISFTTNAAPVTGAKVRLECLQPVENTGGAAGTGSIGSICNPAADDCNTRLAGLFCVPELRECQLSCESDAQCLAGLVCYRPPTGGAPYCVNPTCGQQ